ncbi:MAG: hypothetical protein ACO39G_08610 [Flavobacteriaceae bacterium]
MGIKEKYKITEISKKQAEPFLLERHYARRKCPMTYVYGLFFNEELIGICVFGTSANRNNNSIGDFKVIELNRLFTEDGVEKNVLSHFVAECLKRLPSPIIVISYADPNNGHKGYIYQATNWLYFGQGHRQDGRRDTGITQFRKDGKMYHAKTVSGLIGSSSKKVAEEHGFERLFLPPKHKYGYLIGNKRQKREMLKQIKYPILPYPKGDNVNYDTGEFNDTQPKLF